MVVTNIQGVLLAFSACRLEMRSILLGLPKMSILPHIDKQLEIYSMVEMEPQTGAHYLCMSLRVPWGFPLMPFAPFFFSLARLTQVMSHFPRQPFQARPGSLLKGHLEMQLVQYKVLRKMGTPHPVVSRNRRLPTLLLRGPKTQASPPSFPSK